MQPWLLLLTITLEGYVVLAAELLAIRQLTPYVGNGTDTIAIVIAAVLLPLAIGYHAGGATLYKHAQLQALRMRLARNLLTAGLLLTLGFITIHIGVFFETLTTFGITHRLLRTVLYCALFLVYPVYLLGQTIPLASQAMPPDNLARLTGRMLFYSTLGSFLGSIVSTLVLMAWLGVNNTFTITLTLLMVLVILITANASHRFTLLACLLTAYTAFANSDAILAKLHIVQNNAYTQVSIEQHAGIRYFGINNSFSSRLGASPLARYPYIVVMEALVAQLLPTPQPHNILVIGAGGFTFGNYNHTNSYTYLDIDPDLKTTAEKYFLGHKLRSNQKFVVQSARPYLAATNQKYDAIVLDAYSNRYTLPADLITVEFFRQLKDHLNPGGIMVANIIASRSFATPFSRAIDATFRSAFPYITREIVFEPTPSLQDEASIIYLYIQPKQPQPPSSPHPYTDMLNRYFLHH